MPAEPADATAAPATAAIRCGCGRLAMARCWLGEHSPARWLVGCPLESVLEPEAPEAA